MSAVVEAATKEQPVDVTEAPAAQLPAIATPGREPLKIRDQAHYDSLQEAGVSPGYIVPRSTAQITKAIAAVMRDVDIVAKRGVNQFHRYKYASMQDILQQITPLLGKHGLAIFQDEVERSMFDQEGVIAIKYTFTVAHESGEIWPHLLHQTGVSRCRDSKGGWDDKSLNKCHTAARKYFLLSLFQIPTGDEDESDKGGNDGGDEKLKSVYASKPIAAEIKAAFLACKSIEQLKALGDEKAPIIGTLNILCQDDIRETFATHRKNLRIDAKYNHAEPAETVDAETGEVTDQVIWEEDGERPATAADKPDPQDIPESLRRLTPDQERAWLGLLAQICQHEDTTQGLLDLQTKNMTPAQQRKVTPAVWAEAVKVFRERMQHVIDNPAFDAEAWLKGDLAGALSGAETLEQLAKVKNAMVIPHKDTLKPDQWKRAVAAYRERMDEIDPQNGLAGG